MVEIKIEEKIGKRNLAIIQEEETFRIFGKINLTFNNPNILSNYNNIFKILHFREPRIVKAKDNDNRRKDPQYGIFFTRPRQSYEQNQRRAQFFQRHPNYKQSQLEMWLSSCNHSA